MDEEKFPFKCDFCEKSFFNEEILGLHIKTIHKSIIEGRKKCQFCDKTYHSKISLYFHVSFSHVDKVNFLIMFYHNSYISSNLQ